jgi:hypothetical protein
VDGGTEANSVLGYQSFDGSVASTASTVAAISSWGHQTGVLTSSLFQGVHAIGHIELQVATLKLMAKAETTTASRVVVWKNHYGNSLPMPL